MSLKKKIRIVIADDQELDRAGLKSLLSTVADLDIVGEANTIASVFSLVKTLNPDVLLLDLQWHDNEGAGARIIRELKKNVPNVRIVAQTNYRHLIDEAYASGADVAVTKTYSRSDLVEFIRGESIDIDVDIKNIGENSGSVALTEREHQVLIALADGKTDIAIAHTLGISVSTVKHHVGSIYRKLDVNNRAEAASRGNKLGLV